MGANYDPRLENSWLDMISKAQSAKEKNRLEFFKEFVFQRIPSRKLKRQPTKLEKYFKSVSGKIISRICKILLKHNIENDQKTSLKNIYKCSINTE
jgi:hypothetical protein